VGRKEKDKTTTKRGPDARESSEKEERRVFASGEMKLNGEETKFELELTKKKDVYGISATTVIIPAVKPVLP